MIIDWGESGQWGTKVLSNRDGWSKLCQTNLHERDLFNNKKYFWYFYYGWELHELMLGTSSRLAIEEIIPCKIGLERTIA